MPDVSPPSIPPTSSPLIVSLIPVVTELNPPVMSGSTFVKEDIAPAVSLKPDDAEDTASVAAELSEAKFENAELTFANASITSPNVSAIIVNIVNLDIINLHPGLL
jgi:hypothetical protein